jgi:ATP-dependent DNA helicase RecG
MVNLAQQDIKFLPGVGPQRSKLLNDELHIFTFDDLLHYYPYKYVDRSRIYSISELTGDMPYVQLRGRILSADIEGEGRKRRFVAHFSDGTGVVDLVWFQGLKYITGHYKVNKDYIVFGKPTQFNGRINISHPDMDDADTLNLSTMGLQPYYNTTEKMKRSGLNSHAMERLTASLFRALPEQLPETLTPEIVVSNHLVSVDFALRHVHYPMNTQDLQRARQRLKFEELFYVELNILRYTKNRANKYKGFVFSKVGPYFNRFYKENLPFALTSAQKRVMHEIRDDMRSGGQMNRLLQGDVGSGKTLVALMSMLIAIDNGYQTCIVAPTEILAEQHFATLTEMLAGLGLHIELLTGIIKGKRRKAILEGLQSGAVHILIGTHAVFEDTVQFRNIGLVIIDEQHRFGVAQRAKLWTKNDNPPHVLVMTATPIPRTLAMTLYGDLKVSVIDELPPGRKPILTLHQYDNQWRSLCQGIRREITAGRQVYVVYPLIKESEKSDLKNLEDGYVHFKETFPEYNISRVHGQLKSVEKEEEMRKFVAGETQILVSTTVIEVGVNVPNATVMIIENAERFGLAQLHQLRGRVGRGGEQSYCILVTRNRLSAETHRRIEIMTETNDGFEIAEADLKLRGPGDLEGTQQSGIAFDLRIADLGKDGQLLELARSVAQEVVDTDGEEKLPEYALLWRRLQQLRKTNINWAAIS